MKNIQEAIWQAIENDDDSLFIFLKNDMFDLIKSFKNAYSALVIKGKARSVSSAIKIHSELMKLRKEIIDMEEWQVKEILQTATQPGSNADERKSAFKNIKMYQSFNANILKEIKLKVKEINRLSF